jgi:hypothetical protein
VDQAGQRLGGPQQLQPPACPSAGARRHHLLKGPSRLQLGALDELAKAAEALGRWDDLLTWSEQSAKLAHSIGAGCALMTARSCLGLATVACGDHAAPTPLHKHLPAELGEAASPNLGAAVLQRLGV